MTAVAVRDATQRLVAFYEQLVAADVARFAEFYAPDAYFRDPFHEVRGVVPIQRIFDRMFADLDACRFRILDTIADERGAVLVWDFTFSIAKFRPDVSRCIHGTSHLRFDAEGRVTYHRDYWDAAGELYAQLPLVGPLLRFLKRRFA